MIRRILGNYFFPSYVSISSLSSNKLICDISRDVSLTYYYNNELVSYVKYSLETGEISIMKIEEQYQNKKIGTQILENVIYDMRQNGRDRIYCLSYRNHPFWIKHKFSKREAFLPKYNKEDLVLFYKDL